MTAQPDGGGEIEKAEFLSVILSAAKNPVGYSHAGIAS
jgi:hypothetical protein